LEAAALAGLLMEAHQLTALKVLYLCFPPFNLLVAATVVVEHSQ
jgi:hypothetical protein